MNWFGRVLFRIRYVAPYHKHRFEKVASNTWCCKAHPLCTAWYGERTWT
jgi:hypothetical protein